MLLPLLLISWIMPLSALAKPEPSASRELRVLTYESLASKDGLGPILFQAFEKRCSCKVRVQAAGDAGQIISRLQLEKMRGKSDTQVVVGIDQTLWPVAREFAGAPSAAIHVAFEGVPELAHSPTGKGFIPFDWGVLAFIARDGFQAPRSWLDLLAPRFRRKFILQDPRTSTPGFAFVWGASRVLDPSKFFGQLQSAWLTLAAGWSGSYSLFLRGEAPLVWSYTTSEAFHREAGDGDRYRAVLFEEGNPIQVEGAFAVPSGLRSEAERGLARAFLEYLVSPEVQAEIPMRQWMFPARRGIALPESFARLPAARKILEWDPVTLQFSPLIDRWERWIRQ